MDRLSEWRDPQRGIRIQIVKWHPIYNISGQFIEHPRNVRLILNYILRMGIVSVWRKIRSRLNETKRNIKVSAIGTGIVIQAPEDSHIHKDDFVLFFAPNHPQSPVSTCIDLAFVKKIGEVDLKKRVHKSVSFSIPEELKPYIGWSMYSGCGVDHDAAHRGLQIIAKNIDLSGIEIDNIKTHSFHIQEFTGQPTWSGSLPSAVIFGLGNYAKTRIIPNIKRNLQIRRIHEIDPDQLMYIGKNSNITLDTAPIPRDNTKYDAWFIAGYHHTHTDLAIDALRQGSYAVIEKPISTTWDQFYNLSQEISSHTPSKFFACFHKRYSILNKWAFSDFAKVNNQPIDMHCVVYEIPLPALHWYNWPNSGSRLISNGCHWIDYFMFMNNYAKVIDYGLWQSRGRDLVVFARLENDACFAMSLTDTGSQRLGVRDYIELRSGSVTVKLIDSSKYESENRFSILRRRKVNPSNAYKEMYRSISAKIKRGLPGDPIKSLRSTELTLYLEDELKRHRK